MSSNTETAILALVAVLEAKSALDRTILPAPVRNQALPARLASAGANLQTHVNVWDGDTEIDQELLGADVIANGYELAHEVAIEAVVAGGSDADREARFDAMMTAILSALAAGRTLGGAVDTCHVVRISSKQRELVTEGLPNAKGAEVAVRLEFTSSDIR
jgi:hypothetical protein